MDNDMNSTRHFDEVEMTDFEDTVEIYNDLSFANMNLIAQIQKKIKKKYLRCISDDPLYDCFWIEFVMYDTYYDELYYQVPTTKRASQTTIDGVIGAH